MDQLPPPTSTGTVALKTPAQHTSLALQVVFAILSILAVALRLVARRKKNLQLQWDDYLIVVALFFALGLVACDMIGVLYCGVGLHVQEVVLTYGMHRITVFLQVLIPVQILWAASLTATKLSILMFYVRIFDTRVIRLAAKIICTIIFLWCLTVILNAFLLCRPFPYNWDPTIPDGTCGNRVLSYVLTGVLNIITDVLVLCLPIPVIWTLQLRRANKIALTAVFTVGFFVCIVSIIRLKSLLTIDYSDATHSVTLAFIWSMIEPCTGIILACLPIIKVLLGHPFRSISNGSGSGQKYSPSGRRSGFRSGYATGSSDAATQQGDEHSMVNLKEKSQAASVATQEIAVERAHVGEHQPVNAVELGPRDIEEAKTGRRMSSNIVITSEWNVK